MFLFSHNRFHGFHPNASLELLRLQCWFIYFLFLKPCALVFAVSLLKKDIIHTHARVHYSYVFGIIVQL